MTTLLDSVGLAVWQTSWHATALAVVVMLLLRFLGERISPRWRYFLLGVVVVRLACFVTPAAPWSAFNLVHWSTNTATQSDVVYQTNPANPQRTQEVDLGTPLPIERREPEHDLQVVPQAAAPPRATATGGPRPTGAEKDRNPSLAGAMRAPYFARLLSAIWLAGCLLLGVRLAITLVVLRRRLAACRPVTDAAVLQLLETVCRRMRRKRVPQLLVTPDSISPCVVGILNSKIVLPEPIATAATSASLRHVLAHELAHLARGDLWTNWLLLAVRTLHWFNPVAWWTVRAMLAEREAACDELALTLLGETDRPAYAATIVALATNMSGSPLAPAMIPLFSSASRLTARVDRLLRFPSVARLPASVAAALLVVIALSGLTDAMPAVADPGQQSESSEPTPAKTVANAGAVSENVTTETELVTLRGRCVDGADDSAMSGVRVRLFKVAGRTAPIVEAGLAVTDDEGQFEFADFAAPRDGDANRLLYLLFAEADNRPVGMGGSWTLHESDPFNKKIHVLGDSTTFSGTIVNSRGVPIAGAKVAQWDIDGRSTPGILSATTGADGRFEIQRIPDFRKAFGRENAVTFTVSHPDYPITDINVPSLPADVEIILADGCLVTGTVTDRVTGQPAAGTVVVATDAKHAETPAATGGDGTFHMVLAEDHYTFRVDAKDRVCIALTDRECLAGEKMELPPLELIAGGFISGRVINAATGNPVVESNGRPITIGLTGPTHPPGKVRAPARLAIVDDAGRFTLRAAPGENFPYFANIHGDRMVWDTLNQPPVVVKEGQTTTYDMLITPPVPPAEKLTAARKLVASLPAAPAERTERILLEFRKLSHTVDEAELWCTLMRELVAIGPRAVPQICDELDRTTEDRALRRLAFALRAIGDRRAVPALIRALSKTLLPPSSDYGLLVGDAELTAFMQQHDLSDNRGQYFDVHRPVREISGTIVKLTGHTSDDAELFNMFLSEDPRRQILQRRLFRRMSLRWQTWWDAHGREFVDDAAYQTVTLEVVDEPLPPPSKSLSANARLVDGTSGAILSPAVEGGEHARHFYDLDTGLQPKWPTNIVKDESRLDERRLAEWVTDNGVDLMCVTCFTPGGTDTFVLRGFGLEAWEISLRDLRNLDKLVAAGKLPEGRPVDEYLMHYDSETKQFNPDANAAFLYITREGSLGVIETTDRVTQTADLTGRFGPPPRGVGFFKGVRFNLKTIIP